VHQRVTEGRQERRSRVGGRKDKTLTRSDDRVGGASGPEEKKHIPHYMALHLRKQ
jgi:hypothetical protein